MADLVNSSVDVKPISYNDSCFKEEISFQVPNKKVRRESCWKRNTRKLLRNSGKEYVNSTGKKMPAKMIGCPCTCSQKCFEKISQQQRENIFKAFYNLSDYNLQNVYLCGRVRKLPVKRRYSKQKEKSRRQFTFQYTVMDENNEKIIVCEKAFLSIHSVSHGRVQRALHSSSDVPQMDQRGRHKNRVNKIPDEDIENVKNHINSFPRWKTYYSREYLHPDLNIRKMYVLYLEHCLAENRKPVKECTYRKIFCEYFHLSFGSRKTWDFMHSLAIRQQFGPHVASKQKKRNSLDNADSYSPNESLATEESQTN